MRNFLKILFASVPLMIVMGCGPGTGGPGGDGDGDGDGDNSPFPVLVRAEAIPGVSGDFLVDGDLITHGPSMEAPVGEMGTYSVTLNCPSHHFFDKEVSVAQDGTVTPAVTTWEVVTNQDGTRSGNDWCVSGNGNYQRMSDGAIKEITTDEQCRIWGLPLSGVLVTGEVIAMQEATGEPGRTIDAVVSIDARQITYNLRQDGVITGSNTLTLVE